MDHLKEFTPRDWERIELYMKAGATPQKVADAYAVPLPYLICKMEDHYCIPHKKVFLKFQTQGELLIVTAQLQRAISGNVALLLYLGKIRCGQKEPDGSADRPPNESEIDKDQRIMQLENENAMLKEIVVNNGDESQAEQELL